MVTEQQSSRHIPTQPLLEKRWLCWFWCEADAYYRRGQIHFQPSWRCKETSREPKTPFPLKIFLIAIWEYSIAFFDRERRVFNSIWKKQRYCYVKCNYGCKHRSPLNVFVRRFDEQSLKPVYWFSRSMGQSEIQKRPERFSINIFTSQKRKLLYSALLKQ